MGYDGLVASNGNNAEPYVSTTGPDRSTTRKSTTTSIVRRPRDTYNYILPTTPEGVSTSASLVSRNVIDNSAGKYSSTRSTVSATTGLLREQRGGTEKLSDGRLANDKKHRQSDQMPPPGG